MSTSFNQTGKTVLSQSQFNARQQAGTLTEGEYLIKATGQPAMQVTAMPTSPTTGDIVQWVGATTASYTNGHFYKYNGSTWEEVSLGGSSPHLYRHVVILAKGNNQNIAGYTRIYVTLYTNDSTELTSLNLRSAIGEIEFSATGFYHDTASHSGAVFNIASSGGENYNISFSYLSESNWATTVINVSILSFDNITDTVTQVY